MQLFRSKRHFAPCAERAWWVLFIWLRAIPTSGSSIAYCRVVHEKINEKMHPRQKVSKEEQLHQQKHINQEFALRNSHYQYQSPYRRGKTSTIILSSRGFAVIACCSCPCCSWYQYYAIDFILPLKLSYLGSSRETRRSYYGIDGAGDLKPIPVPSPLIKTQPLLGKKFQPVNSRMRSIGTPNEEISFCDSSCSSRNAVTVKAPVSGLFMVIIFQKWVGTETLSPMLANG